MAFFSGPIDNAFITIANDGSFSLDGHVQLGSTPVPPTPPTPPTSGDQVNLATAQLGAQSPDVRNWPIGAHLSSLMIPATEQDGPDASMGIDFSKRWGSGAWPIVMGAEGEIQYTLWVGCQILGVWWFSGSILCISRGENDNYVPTGPIMRQGQLPSNWYYYAGSPMAGYQPARGEQVAWFLTSGVQRRTDIHLIAERTQVVLAPFTPGTYSF